MEFEILKEKDMKLLSRKRVTLMMENKGATPSRQDIIKKLADKLKVKEDLVVVKHIYSQYGKAKTKLIVNIYKDKKKMEMFEHANLLKKHKVEKPAEEVKEEKLTTEEKPEKKQEEAPEEKKEAIEEKTEEVPLEKVPEVKTEPAEEPKLDSKKEPEPKPGSE